MPTMSISWIAFSRFCGGFLASFRDTTFLFDHKPAGNQIEPTATVPDCPDHQFTLAPCTAPKWARVGRPSFQSGTLFIMENGMENGTKVCFWSAIVADEKNPERVGSPLIAGPTQDTHDNFYPISVCHLLMTEIPTMSEVKMPWAPIQHFQSSRCLGVSGFHSRAQNQAPEVKSDLFKT